MVPEKVGWKVPGQVARAQVQPSCNFDPAVTIAGFVDAIQTAALNEDSCLSCFFLGLTFVFSSGYNVVVSSPGLCPNAIHAFYFDSCPLLCQ